MRGNSKKDIEELCRSIQDSNENALEQLINMLSPDLYIYALGFVKQKEIAEELVSDIFVQIWKGRDTIQKINNLKAYLHILTKNRCISHLRKTKKDRFISLDHLADFQLLELEAKNSELIDSETLEKLNKALSELPPRCKMVFTLAKINGLPYKEVGQIMDISVKTVDNQIAHALKCICKSLGMPENPSKKKTDKVLSIFF